VNIYGVVHVLQCKNIIAYARPNATHKFLEAIKEEPWEEAKLIVDTSPSCLKPIEIPPQEKEKMVFLVNPHVFGLL